MKDVSAMNDKNLPTTRQHNNLLFDFYGTLLTEKQKDVFAMHCVEDYSLTEIAGIMKTTPQAVVDVVKRAQGKLDNYEEKLGMVSKFHSQQEIIQEIASVLDGLENMDSTADTIRKLANDLLL